MYHKNVKDNHEMVLQENKTLEMYAYNNKIMHKNGLY